MTDPSKYSRRSDSIYREALDELMELSRLAREMTESDLGKLNKVWSQLEPWDDPRQSLQILSTRFTLTTLSNGSMASVMSSAKMAKLPFDFILTGVLVESAEPDTKVYPFACEILGLRSC